MTEYTKEQCEEYAKDNLKACAKEILEWKHTAILSDGHLRELALGYQTGQVTHMTYR